MNHLNLNLYILNFNKPKDSPKIYKLNDSIIDVNQFGNIMATSLDNWKLAFYQGKRIGIYDLIDNKILFEKSTEGSDSPPIYFDQHKIPLHYVDRLNLILVQCFDYREKEKKYAYDSQFQYKLNWRTNEWDILPIKYPKSWNNGELGISAFASADFKGDSILYNFSNEDSVTIYNTREKSIKKSFARSTFHQDIIPLDSIKRFDTDKSYERRRTDFLYSHFLYDHWKKRYYRFYEIQQDLRKSDGFYNGFDDKYSGVIVLDSALNIVGEIKLPDAGINGFYISNKGLFYIIPNELKDNHIKYAVIDIKI